MATTNLQVRVTADPTSFMQAMGQVNGALSKADAQARKTTSGFAAFGSSLQTVGLGMAATITAPIVGFGLAAIKASADMEVLTMGLTSVMKSSKLAGAEMDKLKVLARMPGIDLEGAVRGSTRLQALGRSADSSRRIMGELANAIAVAGGGKDDFREVTRQLGQMQSVGKVTKENLDTITERIPQISRIMIETWGPQSVGDPAKFFEAAGISSAKFIEIITDKLAEGARAGNTFKNSFENAMQDSNLALVEFGEVLKPIAQKILDDFATPVIKKVTEVAKAFKELPASTQGITVATAAIVAAAPLAIIALGSVLTNLTAIKTAFAGFAITLTAAGTAISAFGASAVTAITSMAGVAAGTAGATAAIGLFYAGALVAAGSIAYLTNSLYDLYKAESKLRDANDSLASTTEKLLERVKKVHPEIATAEFLYRKGGLSLEAFNAEVQRLAKGMPSTTTTVKVSGATHEAAAKAVAKHAKAKEELSFWEQVAADKISAEHHQLSAGAKAFAEWSQKHSDGAANMKVFRSELDWMTDAVKKFQAEMAKAAIVNLPTPVGFPGLPDKPFGTTGGELARQAGGRSSADLRKDANAAGDAYERVIELQREGKATAQEARVVYDAWVKAEQAAAGETAKAVVAQSKALQQVSTIITDLSRGLARNIVDWKGWRETGIGAVKNLAEAVTRLLIEDVLKRLSTKLIEVSGLMSAIFKGATGVASSAAPAIGAAAGLAVPTIGAAVGLGGQIGAGAAVPAAGGISGAVGGLTSIVGSLASVGSLISGIVGNFQNMAMNKSLDLIEREVRYSQIHLLNTLNRANEFWPYMKLSWESLLRMEGKGAGAGGTVINNNMAGAYLLNDSALDDFIERITRRLKLQGL